MSATIPRSYAHIVFEECGDQNFAQNDWPPDPQPISPKDPFVKQAGSVGILVEKVKGVII